MMSFARCLILLLVPLLTACASRGIPPATGFGEQPEAREILLRSAKAHGLANWGQVRDINVSYVGEWRWLVPRLQPLLIDPDFRQSSQERLLPGDGGMRIGQQFQGPGGEKTVYRDAGSVQVAYNGQSASDPDVLAAAALVADGYQLFLTGPFYFLQGNVVLETAGSDRLDGHLCDLLVAVRRPGGGLAAEDRYQLWIDRDSGILRRVRFTLDGLASTQGAVAEVDFFDHREIGGIVWPTRFFERLLQPIPGLPVHDWRLTGLDLNRGLAAAEIAGGRLSGKAMAPAQILPASR